MSLNVLKSRAGQFSEVEELVPAAVAIVSLVIAVAIGALLLGGFETASFDDVAVTEERQNITGTLPQNITVDRQSQADFERIEEDSVTVVHFDDSAASNTTLPNGNFTVFNSDGTVQVDTVTAYEDPADVFFLDYTSLEDSDEAGVFDTGIGAVQDFADFFSIVVVVLVAAVIFILLAVVRRNGQSVAGR